jgi:DNA/RNA-binding protein KIN17
LLVFHSSITGKWYISWIDKDPKALARAAAREKAEAMELTEQERQHKMLQRQIEAMKKLESSSIRSKCGSAAGGDALVGDTEQFEQEEDEAEDSDVEDHYKDFDDEDFDGMQGSFELEEPVGGQALEVARSTTKPQKTMSATDASMPSKPSKLDQLCSIGTVAFNLPSKAPESLSSFQHGVVFGSDDSNDDDMVECVANPSASTSKRQMSAVESIVSEIQEKKRREEVPKVINMRDEKFKRRENWLAEGIVVKIIDKELGDGRFYKMKAYVRSLLSSFIAEVKLIESNHVIKIDQRDLETVLPAVRPGVGYALLQPHRFLIFQSFFYSLVALFQ